MIDKNNIICVILAGGIGSRLDGKGKLNQKIGKHTLLDLVYNRVQSQFNTVAINVKSRKTKIAIKYKKVIYDHFKQNIGPIAGIHSAISFALKEFGNDSLVVTVPVDTPFLPKNLLKKLYLNYNNHKASVIVAKSNGRYHPTIALWETKILKKLEFCIEQNVRKIDKFTSNLNVSYAIWDNEKSDPFFNINNYNDLKLAKNMLDNKDI